VSRRRAAIPRTVAHLAHGGRAAVAPRRRVDAVRAIAGLGFIGLVMTVPVGCTEQETWSYQSVPEREWHRLASTEGPQAAEAARVLMLMDEEICRTATTALLADLDSNEAARRIAALDAIAEEPAHRRWFPTEIRDAVANHAASWRAPLGEPRSDRWTRWIDELPATRRAEARAIVRAMATDPDTTLGMAGPARVEAALGRTSPVSSPVSSTSAGRLRALR
jgi:hypothetical protein